MLLKKSFDWSISSSLANSPVPVTAWYVDTFAAVIFDKLLIASITITSGVVVQFGVETTPGCQSISFAFTSGTINGMVGSRLKTEPLSITKTPFFIAISTNCSLTVPPAAKIAIFRPLNESLFISLTVKLSPRYFIFLPFDLLDANGNIFSIGWSLSSSIWIAAEPTTPVAPTIAIFRSLMFIFT